ncbi:TonB-dependent receptor [Pedobacter cryophilus]|uniref:TonB-dependent receptor n=1 Tax=Pedobacter cryophilus TaxID=2571271 RepID=A0A4V5NX42_9SPHI|nr:TonB-dependent receptor [Pedobacter cryophilus]TKB97677.1 TonB-dependent receptor [Pedobacter cryophilus]
MKKNYLKSYRLKEKLSSLITMVIMLFCFQAVAFPLAEDAVVSGRIKDKQTGEYLIGVNVQLKGTTLRSTTNSEGFFRFSNLPEGRQMLVVTYLGFSNKEVSVNASQTPQELFVELEASTTTLGEVVVTGLRRSQIQSINQKKEALNIREVITANEAGRLPDINVAEATQRVSGVSIETDRGEGQFVSIRGIQPSLNNVTLNNSTLASTRDSRATGLDLLPTEIISSIEVIKTNTPDMEGNAIGGTINVNTLSAFDKAKPFVNFAVDGLVQTQQVDLSGFDNTRAPFRGAVTAGKRFGKNEKFGVVGSANFFRRDFSASILDPDGWEFFNYFYPNEIELQIEDIERDRLGLSADFEYRPSKNSSIYLKSLYTQTKETQLNSEFELTLQIGSARPTNQTPTTGRFVRGSGELDQAFTNEIENLYSYTLGTKNRFGKLSTDVYGTFSRAKTNLNNFDATFENPTATEPSLSSTYDTAPFFFTITPDNIATASDPEIYKLRNLNFTTGLLTENIYEISTDLKYDLNVGKTNAFIKFGGRYRDRSKESDRSRDSYDLSYGGVTIPNANAYSLTPFYFPVSVPSQGGATPFVHGNVNKFKEFVDNPANVNNTSKLVFDKLVTDQQLYLNDFKNSETVTAGYAMGVIDFKKLTIITGLRVEHTQTTSENAVIATNRGVATPSTTIASNNYTNFLPSLQLKFTPIKNFITRASYTNTLGRPNYSDLSGATNLNYTELATPGLFTGSVTLANPGLKPYLSSNLDLAFEYYIPNGGIVSVGGFYKKIQNQIYRISQVQRDIFYDGRQYQQLTFSQTTNADDANLYGMEFSYEQTLIFLPGLLNGLGFSTNFALIDSKVTLPNRPNETLPLFRQANNVYNGALYYQKKGFEFRFATSHRSDFLTQAASPESANVLLAVASGYSVADFDRYDAARTTYDISGKYQFPKKKLSISAQVRNLTNAPEQGYQGVTTRYDRHDLTGRSFFLGLALNL